MKRVLLLAVAVFGVAVLATAASVGIVSSTGDFRVDGSSIRGNSTVFEGSIIETASARSNVQLGNVQITLLPDSRLKAYKDYAVLEKGWGIVRQGTVEAASFRIAPAKGSSAIVQMTAPKNVNVVAQGDAQVQTAQGVLVASLRSGMGMAFSAQAPGGAPAAQQMTLAGKVDFANGKCMLSQASEPPTSYELVGWADCSTVAGKYVTVQGTLQAGRTGVVQVNANSVKGIKEADAKKIAAAGTGAAAATIAGSIAGSAGLSTGAIAAIVGGAAAAGLGGAAAAGVFTSGQ